MLSMTGYGRGRARAGDAEVVVEIRAVNHRFFDLRTRLGSALNEHAGVIDELARELVVRGRIELSAHLEGGSGASLQLDKQRARSALLSLRELQAELGMTTEVPLQLLAAVPDLFVAGLGHDSEAVRQAIEAATRSACADLSRMRSTEGAALSKDMRARVEAMRATAGMIAPRVAAVVDEYRKKLRARIEQLLSGVSVALDEGRLELEVALLADKADVTEELTRLVSHCQQLSELLDSPDLAVGRKIEFLLQELGREVNTIGAKVSDLEVTRHVLALKAELQRLREQAQNVL